jgi:hypothetical protein
MQPRGVRHADVNPAGNASGQVAHRPPRLIAVGEAVGHRDAVAVLEAVGEHARDEVLG